MRSSVSSVPATSANLAAALTIAACALYALKYLREGTLGFIAACYAVWLVARAYNIWFGLRKNQPWFLSGPERGIYKHFALYLYRPQLAFFFSTTLHWLRLAVFAWILVALWQGLYVEAIVLALFTVLVSGTISSMYPDLYFDDAARTGNRGAAEMLRDLRHVQSLVTPSDKS
jgi:hypothetical protein